MFAILLHAADDCGGVPLVFFAAFATFLNESTDSFGEKRAHGVFRAAGVKDGVSFVAAAATTVATAVAGWVRVCVLSIAGAEV
jgi:hypothetical protein